MSFIGDSFTSLTNTLSSAADYITDTGEAVADSCTERLESTLKTTSSYVEQAVSAKVGMIETVAVGTLWLAAGGPLGGCSRTIPENQGTPIENVIEEPDLICKDDTEELYYADEDGDLQGSSDNPIAAKCTNESGEEIWDTDNDGDYDDAAPENILDLVDNADDCDDADPDVKLGGKEICDGKDNDCDGEIDNDAEDALTWYADNDGDGFGNPDDWKISCEQPEGYVADSSDCDDGDAEIAPGIDEICDGFDNNCDGITDEDALDKLLWYADTDSDNYGDPDNTLYACYQPDGYTNKDGDCVDANNQINPSIRELCATEYDDNCDDTINDGGTSGDATMYYVDADSDGFGNAAVEMPACEQPAGYVADATDCDDGRSSINPDETEVCDGFDNDCSGTVDGSDAADATTWYADNDGDGYGDPATSAVDCSAPSGYVDTGTDCDDLAATVNPGTIESWDGLSNECDATTDNMALPDSGYLLAGVASGNATGRRVAAGGDLDGDGIDDVLVAASLADDGRDPDVGAVYAASGSRAISDMVLSAADATMLGDSSMTEAGSAIAFAGDTDGDGFDDFLVGASNTSSSSTDWDQVFLVNGLVAGSNYLSDVAASGLGAILYGEEDSGDSFGVAVAGVGDTNLDGYEDVVVGANTASPNSRSDAGAAYLFLGPVLGEVDAASADARFIGATAGDQLAGDIASGDDDGDGETDYYFTNEDKTMGNSAIYVVHGPASGDVDMSSASAVLTSEQAGDSIGRPVVTDIDGDGYDDVVVGAHGYDGAGTDLGAVYLAYGPQSSMSLASAYAKIEGVSDYANAGYAVEVVDVNGDGEDDVIIGIPGESSYAGSAFIAVISGPIASGTTYTSSASATMTSGTGFNFFGRTFALGDFDSDGDSDLIAGEEGDNTYGSFAGAAYVLINGL